MAPSPEYKCTNCGREVGKHNLKVKRVEFKEMGKGGANVKSRTVAWLCVIPHEDGSPSCIEQDPAWNLPAWASSPGMIGSVLEEENAESIPDDPDQPLFPPEHELEELSEYLRYIKAQEAS